MRTVVFCISCGAVLLIGLSSALCQLAEPQQPLQPQQTQQPQAPGQPPAPQQPQHPQQPLEPSPNGVPVPAQIRKRPTPPTRDPHTSGFVDAQELPDGQLPSPDEDGNFIIGPTHQPAPEAKEKDNVP